MGFVIVFLGAGFGGAMRHAANLISLRFVGAGFPFGTMVINVLGSLLMGLLTELFAVKMGLPQHTRLFLTTGILGGFTTFSTFSLEAALLWERGQPLQAAAYVGGSVILGIGALLAAMWLVRTLTPGGV